jgi:diguanylate cyclase (GGDEF)-like protein/PAS domain S-box-containing protein
MIASALFLLAGILILWPLRRTPQWWGWITLGLGFIALALLVGIDVILGALGIQADLALVSGVLILAAAFLVCAGVYLVANSFINEHRARTALQRYRLFFEEEPSIQVIKDRQGEYVAVNPAFARFLGKQEQELTGETDFKFFPRGQANAFRQAEEKAIESAAPQTQEEEFRGPDGTYFFRMTRIPLMDKDNSPIGILISGKDITTHNQAQTTLTEWERGLSLLYDAEIALGEPFNLDIAQESILIWAGRLADTPHAGLWKINPAQSTAILEAGQGKLESSVGIQLRAGEGIAWKVWQSGQTAIVDDYQNWPNRGEWGQKTAFRNGIGLPLKSNAQVIYVLTMFHDRPGKSFRPELVQILNLFTQCAASRLQNSDHIVSLEDKLEDRRLLYEKLQYRARLEHVLAVIATNFIVLDPNKVDEGINHSLQTLAGFSGVDRCYLVLFPKDGVPGTNLSIDYSSVNGTAEGEQEDISRDEFNWYLSKLNQFDIVHIPSLDGLSPEAYEAAEYLKSRGIKSYTAIPLVSNRSVIGYLGLEVLDAEREFSQDILSLWKVSAEMFVNMLERRQHAIGVKETQEKVSRQILDLEQINRENALITEMGDLLQACRTADEAYPIITRQVQRLIPVGSGALYMIDNAKGPAVEVASWGSVPPGLVEQELALNDCWGLRRGRIYVVQDPTSDPLCGHLSGAVLSGYLCVPLIAQGVVVGLLHLRYPDDPRGGSFDENQQRLALKVAEYISMALTNLRLRDELRSQAIRDPLTGLFNRRYMEETLEREIRRATRHSTSVGIIMFDIDSMKPINDSFGHDGGDLVLMTLGKELLKLFRGEDVACRYGGDEFTIVLPEASLSDVWSRAEQLREVIKRIDLKYEGQQMGPLTLSIGVAAYPDHGLTAERVLLASDAASYAAKSEGGDRIMMGHKTEP